jgi:hypothetical protein
MRKISKIISLLIVFMFILPILSNVKAYETNRDVSLSIEQTSDNNEIVGGIGVLGTYPYFSHPKISEITIDYQYSVIDVSNILSYTSYSSDPITITSAQTAIAYDLAEFTRGANTEASIDFKYSYNFNWASQHYDSFVVSLGYESEDYIHCDVNKMIDLTYTLGSDYDLVALLQGFFVNLYSNQLMTDDEWWSGNPYQNIGSDIYVNGVNVFTGTTFLQLYNALNLYVSVSASTEVRYVLDLSECEFTRLLKDCFTIRMPYSPFISLSIDEIDYIIDAIPYSDLDISLSLGSRSLASGVIYLTYSLDISDLEDFDENKDILFEIQEIGVTSEREYEVALTSHLESVSYESIFASEYDIELNNELLTDTSKGNAQLIYYEYPASLIFDASESNIKFEFTMTDFFSYDFELGVISNSYLRSILQTNDEHSLQLTQVDYLFTSEIKHSYVNNIDYLTDHTIYPDANIIEDSSIKIEVLLDDSVYLPLAIGSYAEQTETLNYNYLTDASEISLNSIAYPASTTITISDIWGYNDAILSNIQNESQLLSEHFDSDNLTDSEIYPETILDSGLMTGFVAENAANGVVATQGTYSNRKTAWYLNGLVGISYIKTNTYADMILNSRTEFWANLSSVTPRLAIKCVNYDGATQIVTQVIFATTDASCIIYIGGSNKGAHTTPSFVNQWVRFVQIVNCTSTVISQTINMYYANGTLMFTDTDSTNKNNYKIWKIGLANPWATSTKNYVDSFNVWSYFSYSQDLNINRLENYQLDESFLIDFIDISDVIYNLTINTEITCDIEYQLSIYNYYLDVYQDITDIYDELNYANLFVETKQVLLRIIADISVGPFDLTITGESEIYYYKTGEYNILKELTISEIGLTINDIEISELVYELELADSQNLVFNTELICYFNVQIDLTYQIANNFEQLSESLTTDDNVEFRYFYKADHDYNKWYTPKLDNLISYEFFDGLIELTTQSDVNNIYFTRSLLIDDIIYADYVLDPSFIINTTVLENNGTYCYLKIEISSDIAISDLEIIVRDFDSYFEDWLNATQSEFDKSIRFSVDSIDLSNIFYLEATTTPPLVSFSSFQNSLEFIDEDWNETIEFNGILDIPQYSEMFRIPVTDWDLDGVFYGTQSYAITNNVFTCEGFNENTISAYLHFYTNPIVSFEQIQSSNNITITINSTLGLDCYIVFHIDNLQSYNLNDDVESLYSTDDSDYYYVLVELSEGVNVFTYTFTEYNVTNVLTYLIPVGIVIGLLAIGFWLKNRKNKREKGLKEVELKSESK